MLAHSVLLIWGVESPHVRDRVLEWNKGEIMTMWSWNNGRMSLTFQIALILIWFCSFICLFLTVCHPLTLFLSITVYITYFAFFVFPNLISFLFLQLSYKCFSSTNIHIFVIAVRVRIGLERLREGVIEVIERNRGSFSLYRGRERSGGYER